MPTITSTSSRSTSTTWASRGRSSSAEDTSTASLEKAIASCACPRAASSVPCSPAGSASSRELAAPNQAAHVQYGRGAARFAGATYDPTSHYRAAAVFRFHQELGLTPTRLREISQHQTTLLESALRALDIDSQGADIVEMPHDRRAGFMTVRTPHAMQLVRDLRARGVFVDARGAMLRLGPAPYVTDQQLEAAAVLVNEVIRNPKP